MARKYGHLF